MTQYNVNMEDAKPSFTDLAKIKPKNVLEAAELYTRMGLCVNPCKGKKPILKGWPQLRLYVKDLPQHFNDGQNVALILGEPSDWLVNVDIDVPEALKIADLFLEDTLCGGRESTPRAHRYYKARGAKTMKWLDMDDTVLLELRSTEAQTLVEPSMHPSGESYAWDRGGVLKPVETSPKELEERGKKLVTATVIARHLPPVGGRHEYAKAVIGYLLRRLDEETVLEIVQPAWHAGDGDSEEAVQDLKGIVGDTRRRLAESENAFGGPTLEEASPGLPKLLARWWGWEDRKRGKKGSANQDDLPTHDELCDAWLETRKDPTAFGQSEWRRYGAGFWAPVHEQIVNREIDEILIEAKPEGINPTSGMRGSVEKLAQAKAFVPDEVWDANEDILACANGTLEISSATLREHRPEDYSLSALPYEFDPEASAPSWHRFLVSTVPDAAGFLQEFAGYALTGDTSHELAVWLYGPPGGGKSTFIEGLRAVFGARAGLLGLAEIQRSRFALADLPGKTLLVATEQPSDFLKSTDILNAIISGEEVKAEQKFRRAFTVIPRAKICWAMNELPRVKDNNNGLFRRVKVVPFPKLRVKKDRELKEKIKEEGAGILVWALEGLKRLHERGYFEIPKCVREATEQFRQTSDVPGIFVEEACITSDAEGCEEQAMELYKAYKHWCRTHGHSPMGYVSAAAEWRRLGFGERSLHGRKFYTGVKVDPGWIKAQDGYPRS